MIYVILSAFLYVLATVYPVTSCVLMTTFLMPLCAHEFPSQWRFRFYYGLLWGVIVFTIHWSWVLALIATRTATPLSCLAWVLLVLWCSLWSGLWFCFFPFARLWSTVLFFICMSRYSFFFTGVIEGYPLCNPLVALAWYPSTLENVYWLSDVGAVVLLVTVQIQVVGLWRYKSMKSVALLSGCVLVLLAGYWTAPQREQLTTDGITTICPWWYGCGDPMFAGYRMSHDLCEVMQQQPETKLIVMPESTYCWDVQEYASFLSIWSDSAGETPVLFGTHEIEGGVSHNAVYLLHNNELVFRYRKQHFMPLIERSIWIERLCNQSMINGSGLLSPVITSDHDLIKINGVTYQLFICSEFFFEVKMVKGYPIVLLWNDTWLCLDWTKQLAALFIIYFEKKYHVSVLHMSTLGKTNIKLSLESKNLNGKKN